MSFSIFEGTLILKTIWWWYLEWWSSLIADFMAKTLSITFSNHRATKLNFRYRAIHNLLFRIIGDNAVTSSIRIAQVFSEYSIKTKTRAIWKVYGGMLRYIMNLAHYDAYFQINDDAKKCRFLSVTNNFIFSYISFKLLSDEVLLEECFAMDTLIKLFVSLISVNFLNFSRLFIFAWMIRSSVDLLIRDY